MSNLSIGLVTLPSEETNQLISFLEKLGVQIVYNIAPDQIQDFHIENEELNVWLLNVDDDHWHDNIDQLLDESDASIYFNEPGTLRKQSHPEYWCQNLVNRLYELTGLTNSAKLQPETSETSETSSEKIEVENESHEAEIKKDLSYSTEESIEISEHLTSALDELESTSIGLPSEIAAELVSELEEISPDLNSSVENDSNVGNEDLSFDEELSDLALDETELDQMAESFENTEELERFEEAGDDFLQDEKSDELEIESFSDEIPVTTEEVSQSQIDFGESNEALASNDGLESTDILEAIDFSNSSIPMLESARDDIQADLCSIYEVKEEDDGESVDNDNDFGSLSLDEKTDELEIAVRKDDLDTEIVSELELVSEDLSLDDGAFEELITGKADFLKDLETETETETNEGIELGNDNDEIQLEEIGLSLEEFEEENVTGKAVFIEEDELPNTKETLDEENKNDGPEQGGGLSLESVEGERPQGRAVFIDEDEELHNRIEQTPEITDTETSEAKANETETIEIENSENEDNVSELSLELLGSESKSGRAVFIEQEEEETLEDSHIVEAETSNLSDEREFGFEMEEMDSGEPLKEELLQDDLASQTAENASENKDEELGEEEISLDHLQLVGEASEEPTFEIPMLEDSAMGLEFDELIEQPSEPQEKVPCWAIGASLGGPAAVKRFLQNLPADIKASFIITQHIDDSFLPVLAEILTSSSSFDVKVANGSNPMESGRVYLAPLKGKIVFLKDGSMLVDHSQKWSEPYTPCIDDVVCSLASVYGDKCGAIIFSGMGQDGLKGSKKMIEQGGQVWAQSLDTCADSSMPEAIINAELASVVDTPEKLAEKLADYLSENNKLSNFGS